MNLLLHTLAFRKGRTGYQPVAAGNLPAAGSWSRFVHFPPHPQSLSPTGEREGTPREFFFRKLSSSQSGFSLVEVIVAIAILGIALVGLTEGVTTALSSSKASEVQTSAALLAAGQIETLRAGGDYEDGETEGDFGTEFPQYHWTQTIAAADVSGLHDVDVVVEDAQTGAALYDLRTLLFELPQGTNSVNRSESRGARRRR